MDSVIQKCYFNIGNMRVEILLQGGFSKHGEVDTSDIHRHPNIEAHYIAKGNFRFQSSSIDRTAGEGALVLVPPKYYHSFSAISESFRRLSFELRLVKRKGGAPLYDTYRELFDIVTEPIVWESAPVEWKLAADHMGVLKSEEEISALSAIFNLIFVKLCELLRDYKQDHADIPTASAQVDATDTDVTFILISDYIRAILICPCTWRMLPKRSISRLAKSNECYPPSSVRASPKFCTKHALNTHANALQRIRAEHLRILPPNVDFAIMSAFGSNLRISSGKLRMHFEEITSPMQTKQTQKGNHMKKTYLIDGGAVQVDFSRAVITDLCTDSRSISAGEVPLFTLSLRQYDGTQLLVSSSDAAACTKTEADTYCYTEFLSNGNPLHLAVTVAPKCRDGALFWHLSVQNQTTYLLEWAEFPNIDLEPLRRNGGIGEILFPYNEGALVDDLDKRESSMFPHMEPQYPSMGAFAMFPNMICSQFMAYLFDGMGFYMGAHDASRGVKAIDFYGTEHGVRIQFRHYCGVGYGEDWSCSYPMVWRLFEGTWEDGAEIYRAWFEENLPPHACKVTENRDLPDWYEDSPLIVTYPVRGMHDMDEMKPNALFPYCNALPCLDEIAARTDSRLLVLLMHWEGTAPWAPPHVWPPYGGEEPFFVFRDALHQKKHLLGVYCSGFGYTLQSNLDTYNREEEYRTEQLEHAMCASPKGEVEISRICTAQRKGYDICPASEHGRELLDRAYRPLLESGIDYTQILDQNHGGSQYFCYSREHGHPPTPGVWMTQKMQELLHQWNEIPKGKMLFGCESAAAEPYIGELLFSDNRFELCYQIGKPVPLYAYLYHEYLRNFMGNQVACPFPEALDTLRHRMAYSFAAGDCLTLAMMPNGSLYPHWSGRDFSCPPDKDKALTFAHKLITFYRETAKPYLYAGRMIKPQEFTVVSSPVYDDERSEFPPVYCSAWEANGTRVQIFVNANEEDVELTVQGNRLFVPPMDAVSVEL